MRLSGIISTAVLITALTGCHPEETVTLVGGTMTPPEQFGRERLTAALEAAGYAVITGEALSGQRNIVIGTLAEDFPEKYLPGLSVPGTLGREGFTLAGSGSSLLIAGADPPGVLYGCLELAARVKKEGRLPRTLNLSESPEMVMRGTCVGLQKTVYLPGRTVYEYPYTPENFPWFYDTTLWIRYLDLLVENRFNSLYLWNGHPFASLVKLEDYPYAVEVDEETFRRNEEVFAFLTREAGKRGIFVIQMFYNIIVSKPFAERHQLKTQDRNRPIVPVIADYTRKSVAAFIEKYPNVGLLVTLGEAMNSIEDDVEWFTGTILPGVKEGLAALGRTDEPPIVLRGHDTDARRVMEAALPHYQNLYTMFKYNGESLTTYEPRDSWETIPRGLSEIGTLHISNVHILANLEPFRYGSPEFIRKSILAMQEVQGARGLHLYPQASYWDWPYTADNTDPRLLEMERDRIWYEAWGRYAWKGRRDLQAEKKYWAERLGSFYGCGNRGAAIAEAYDQMGEIAPKLLRTFGISDGNRQTLLLGMFMAQLVNPLKYNVYSNFWSSSGPEKEVLSDFAAKAWKGEPHRGETPPQIIAGVREHGRKAVEALEKAAPGVKANREEFGRLLNDARCYRTFAECFAEKVEAAMLILRYRYSADLADLEKAVPRIEKSLDHFRELVALTENSYLYANSMQTAQRRIPVSGANGSNKTWKELLPQYETELANFKRNVATLRNPGSGDGLTTFGPYAPAEVKILTPGIEPLPLREGEAVYTDTDHRIEAVAGELKGLTGLRMNNRKQREEGTVIRFETGKAVKVMVGYFNGNSYSILPPPTLETDAQANDRGQADIRIANALHIPGLYPVNLYTYSYPAGIHELTLGKGIVLILGFIGGETEIPTHDAGLGSAQGTAIDWLFY